jgi:hypothetical protein
MFYRSVKRTVLNAKYQELLWMLFNKELDY